MGEQRSCHAEGGPPGVIKANPQEFQRFEAVNAEIDRSTGGAIIQHEVLPG